MIRLLCREKGITFSSWSDDWVIELQKDQTFQHIFGYRFNVNNAVSSSISQDKAATYTILQAHDIAAVQHELIRTKVSPANKSAMQDWKQVVIKPLTGTSGHGVHLMPDANVATEMIESSKIAAWAAAPFIDIVREMRIVMLDSKLLLAYEKRPVVIDGLKMFNLGLGASAHDIVPSAAQLTLAQAAQHALNLRLAAVDIIENTEGEYLVLEVNDSIMMEHYARTSSEHKKRAEVVYGAIIDAMFV